MRVCFFSVLFCLASLAQATPGGLDPNGCHQSQKKGFHCHAPSDKAKARNSGESPAERDKRLRRECKDRPNAGVCLGYTR